MTKRMRLLLAGAAVILFALIPGSAGADTVGKPVHAGCGGGVAPAEAGSSLN